MFFIPILFHFWASIFEKNDFFFTSIQDQLLVSIKNTVSFPPKSLLLLFMHERLSQQSLLTVAFRLFHAICACVGCRPCLWNDGCQRNHTILCMRERYVLCVCVCVIKSVMRNGGREEKARRRRGWNLREKRLEMKEKKNRIK